MQDDIKGIVRQEAWDDFPRKITVIKPSTKEEVVMAFNKGRICQFLYKTPNPEIKMTYDKGQEKYVALPNPPRIRMAYSLINNEWHLLESFKNKELPNQKFFTSFSSAMWGYSIWFEGGLIQVNMNSYHSLGDIDDDYLSYRGDVEVVRVYTAQEEAETKARMFKIATSHNRHYIPQNRSRSR